MALLLVVPMTAAGAEDAEDSRDRVVHPIAPRGMNAPQLFTFGSLALPRTTNGPNDLAIASRGRRAVIVADDYLQVVELHGSRMVLGGRTTAAFGEQVALSKDGTTAYVLSDGDQLFVVNVAAKRPKVVRQLRRGAFAPSHAFDIAVTPNGRMLLVKHGFVLGGHGKGKGIATLSLVKPRKPKLVRRNRLAEWGGDVEVARNGKLVVTTSRTVDDYVLIHGVRKKGRLKLAKRLRLPFAPDGIAITRDSRTAYVSSSMTESPGRIARIDLRKRRLVKVVDPPLFEDGTDIAVAPDGRAVLATMWGGASTGTPSLLALDAPGLSSGFVGAGEALYAPQAVEVSMAGSTRGRYYVLSYVGIEGGRPHLHGFTYH
ncbi:hypothetical protein [Nocardioides sp. TF02-7]|uniref:hypothetical protein n=1 Tax=Nocardioides sp. TF02-7 TaxID=2917724 RepID=UPI001F05BCC3|nr:hypothetical protein [Nocardioides sp. TF02-7]UMG92122.1 hypothetical protein MF408_19580 [Nocardioides sp. TF02-7]